MAGRGVVAAAATDAVLVLFGGEGRVAAASAAVVWRGGGAAGNGGGAAGNGGVVAGNRGVVAGDRGMVAGNRGSVVAAAAAEAVVVVGDGEAGRGIGGGFPAGMFEGGGGAAGGDVTWDWGGQVWRSVVAASAAEAVLMFRYWETRRGSGGSFSAEVFWGR